ncbi:MAG: hypothetical protein BWY45_02913 [Euryarchaeota archaeon ADurb.Bin294]|nr:MAG: hypothetical protein BWY45_02913 [Euryarchaeota archaeon ADurb.Bin294]
MPLIIECENNNIQYPDHQEQNRKWKFHLSADIIAVLIAIVGWIFPTS